MYTKSKLEFRLHSLLTGPGLFPGPLKHYLALFVQVDPKLM